MAAAVFFNGPATFSEKGCMNRRKSPIRACTCLSMVKVLVGGLNILHGYVLCFV